MTSLLLFAVIVLTPGRIAPVVQNSAPVQIPAPVQVQQDIAQALTGDWVGLLEYRDYSEPATSTRRVDLPTWLSISSSGDKLAWHYVYDDGPGKVVEETDLVTFDVAHGMYTEAGDGKPVQVFNVTGFETLKAGHGQVVLLGHGRDNDKPAEVRVTLTLRRNLLEVLQESRPAQEATSAGASGDFVFRHLYRLTRANPPKMSSTQK